MPPFGKNRVLVLGGDGFCGWPAALRFSALGADVSIIDNGSRRALDAQLGIASVTPIQSLQARAGEWHSLTGSSIRVFEIDLATDYAALSSALRELQPDIILHFAEQRSAPFSMMSSEGARYSIDNNIRATHNLLAALVETGCDPHLLHLGTIGVYGYGTAGLKLPEGYLRVTAHGADERIVEKEILYPGEPDSVYHLSKALDQQLCAFYVRHYGLRVTDLHQGVVWGAQTEETSCVAALINRLDIDPIYGTVVNRFIFQAVQGQDLTIYGSGDQVRAFIHIEDMLTCLVLAAQTPPEKGQKLRVVNQFAETSSVNALARRVQEASGAEFVHIENPRREPEGNEFDPDQSILRALGFQPRRFADALAAEYLALRKLLIPELSNTVRERPKSLDLRASGYE